MLAAAADIAGSRAVVELVLVGWPLHWPFVAASASSSTDAAVAELVVAAVAALC